MIRPLPLTLVSELHINPGLALCFIYNAQHAHSLSPCFQFVSLLDRVHCVSVVPEFEQSWCIIFVVHTRTRSELWSPILLVNNPMSCKLFYQYTHILLLINLGDFNVINGKNSCNRIGNMCNLPIDSNLSIDSNQIYR